MKSSLSTVPQNDPDFEDHECIMDKLKGLKCSSRSINETVKFLMELPDSNSTVQCLERHLDSVGFDQRLSVFYVYHELFLHSALKHAHLHSKISNSMFDHLSLFVECVPPPKLKKCFVIWQKYVGLDELNKRKLDILLKHNNSDAEHDNSEAEDCTRGPDPKKKSTLDERIFKMFGV